MNPTNPSSDPVGGTPPPIPPQTTPPVESIPPSAPPPAPPPPQNDMHASNGKRGGGMFDFLHSSKKYFALAAIVMLAVAVPLTTYLAGQQQDNRQEASTSRTSLYCSLFPTVATCRTSPTPTPTSVTKPTWCNYYPTYPGCLGPLIPTSATTPTTTPLPQDSPTDAEIQAKILQLCANNGYRSISRANTSTMFFATQTSCTNYFNQLRATFGAKWRTTVCGWFPQFCVSQAATPTTALPTGVTPSAGTPTLSPVVTTTPEPEPPTPTPIQTTSPDGTKLNMAVFLQGIGRGGDNVAPGEGGNPDPFRLQRPVTVELYNTLNELKATASGVVLYNPTNGNFTGTIEPDKAVSAGSYTARVIVPGFLAQNISQYFQVTPAATMTLPQVTLITGDINQDNILSILDYNILLGCYSGTASAKDCDVVRKRVSDLNDDGKVDGLDYNLFLRTMAVQRGSAGAGYSTVNNNPPPPDPTATPTPTVVVTISPTNSVVSPTSVPTNTPVPSP